MTTRRMSVADSRAAPVRVAAYNRRQIDVYKRQVLVERGRVGHKGATPALGAHQALINENLKGCLLYTSRWPRAACAT